MQHDFLHVFFPQDYKDFFFFLVVVVLNIIGSHLDQCKEKMGHNTEISTLKNYTN